jgi:hypothetical protein
MGVSFVLGIGVMDLSEPACRPCKWFGIGIIATGIAAGWIVAWKTKPLKQPPEKSRLRIYEMFWIVLNVVGAAIMVAYLISQRQWIFEIGKWLIFTSLALYWGQRLLLPIRRAAPSDDSLPTARKIP